jgi:toxin ParE1/3/4
MPQLPAGIRDKITHEIEKACRILEDHPFAGRSRNEVRPGLRSVVASPHVVFYRVKNDRAEIVRVLDGRRDLDEIFSHGPDENA